VSEGQGFEAIKEKVLKIAAASRACTEHNTARKQLWELSRDLRGVEDEVGREFTPAELMLAFDEWHQRSQPFLDPAKRRDDYLAAFFAGLGKVRVPTGQEDALNKALEAVSKLSSTELPLIPGMPEASETWRRLAGLHCELSRRSTDKNKTYFLSYRDAARVCSGLSHQEAHMITGALVRLGVVKIVHKGKAGLKTRQAAEFRYLLPDAGDEIRGSKPLRVAECCHSRAR
jgi:hypothetical protein